MVKNLYDEISEYYFIRRDEKFTWMRHKFWLNDKEKIEIADYGSSLALKFDYDKLLPKNEIVKTKLLFDCY